jgi:uncharacterized protein (DUF1330 family)
MSTYFVVELEITNPAAMQPYRDAVSATVEQYGGRYLVLAGATELIEGGPEPKRIVILEFADTALTDLARRSQGTGLLVCMPRISR